MNKTTSLSKAAAKANAQPETKPLAIATFTLAEASANCPAIIAKAPHTAVSERYAFLPTEPIIKAAQTHGWKILAADMPRGSSGTVTGMHRVKMAHESNLFNKVGGEGFPTVDIINSHDRSKRLSTNIGFYRLVCSNGLVIPSGVAQSAKIAHMHQTIESVIEALEGALALTANIAATIDDLKTRKVSKVEASVLAHYATELRYQGWHKVPIEPKQLLERRREADMGEDLWSTFNVVQENLVRGGMTSVTGRKIGGIHGFHDDLRVNKGLWAGVEALRSSGVSGLTKLRKALEPQVAATA